MPPYERKKEESVEKTGDERIMRSSAASK